MSITSDGNETRNANLVLAVKEHIQSQPIGSLVTHKELNEIIGPKCKKYYYDIVGRAKRELIRLGIFLDSVHKQGYRIAEPGSEISICVTKTLKAYRLEIRAAHDALYINTEKIEDQEAKSRTQKLTQQMTARLPFIDNQVRLLEMASVEGKS